MERLAAWSVISLLLFSLLALSYWTLRLQMQVDRGLTLQVSAGTWICKQMATSRRTFVCRELEPSGSQPKLKEG